MFLVVLFCMIAMIRPAPTCITKDAKGSLSLTPCSISNSRRYPGTSSKIVKSNRISKVDASNRKVDQSMEMEKVHKSVIHRGFHAIKTAVIQLLTFPWLIASAMVKLSPVPRSFLIGSFNLKNFGKSKTTKNGGVILKILAAVICRYDIISLLEVFSSSKSDVALDQLLDSVNQECGKSTHYSYIKSDPDESANTSEIVAFFYRTHRFRTPILHDISNHKRILSSFSRIPVLAQFQSKRFFSSPFIFIATHLKPDAVLQEITALEVLYQKMISQFRSMFIFVMGDLNADKPYLKEKDRSKVKFLDDKYEWAIQDGEDTSSGGEEAHAYDRIIYLKEMARYVKSSAVNHYYFDSRVRKAYQGTPVKATVVSDHFPIEMLIKH